MDRNEKLRLSADTEYCHCFKHGLFSRFFEQGLHWFVTHVRPLKVLTLPVKKGGTILCGGLPEASFTALRLEEKLHGVAEENGLYRWAYAEQPAGGAEDFSGYAA